MTRKTSSSTDALQDLNYYYDAVGNITQIRDDAQDTIFFGNSVIEPVKDYTYDALYRLIQALGREQAGANDCTKDNYADVGSMIDPVSNPSTVRNYTQTYTYDAVGNILTLVHSAGTGSYTRNFSYGNTSNRLNSTTVGSNPAYTYTYDARGNMLDMLHLSAMNWNSLNQMKQVQTTSTSSYYQYSGGQRLKKTVEKTVGGIAGAIVEERIYLGSFERYRKYVSGTKVVERTTVHVSDDAGKVAMLEIRTYGTSGDDNGTDETLARYSYSNHLQSSALELNEDGDIISYEEYHPYGTTSYQAMSSSIKATAKRYRFTGKERDEETGLNYHGARYYAPWLCRWVSVDPLESKYAGMSPYNYGFNSPVSYNDPSGMEGENCIPAPANGVKYTTVNNMHYANGKNTMEVVNETIDTPGRPHGVTINDTWQQLSPTPKTQKDGNLVVSNMYDYKTTTTFIPYCSPDEGGTLTDVWERTKQQDPVGTGILNGTWNFGKDAVEGSYNLIIHQPEAIAGLGKFLYAGLTMDPVTHIPLTPQAWQLDMAIAQTAEKFEKGDTYTKSSMGTYGALTLGSFFVGGGEGNAGKSGLLSEGKLADAVSTLREGTDVSVKSIHQARQILGEMPELRPHIDKFPAWSWSEKVDSKFQKFQELWQQPRGTFRGDLVNTSESGYSNFVHDPLSVRNLDHAYNPHYNIKFFNGAKAAIIIK